ncbi:MAG TPA: hypothetical protein VL728_13440 [Cyclobacteriaceae bacterium]|jgi:hypothetical protein|nr:hypothetical protein [Cyclobacteriaceae bacterium]
MQSSWRKMIDKGFKDPLVFSVFIQDIDQTVANVGVGAALPLTWNKVKKDRFGVALARINQSIDQITNLMNSGRAGGNS